MTEKEYYNELVLQEYYHKLFDDEIEKQIIKPLRASIINTFTGFIGGSVGEYSLIDDNGKKVKVFFRVEKEVLE